ncbi:MAG: alpha/beta fold hydrolase [Gammaproteobacteria bacterium]|nr:alpha/beta fold hydrolase [Gammaproteobacteria bacterium]
MSTTFWADLRGGEFSQGYVVADGIRTRYLHAGRAGQPPLIFLHGTGGHAECWSRNLIAHGAHFDTWAIDMIGHGYTDKPAQPYEIDIYVEHLRAFMDERGFARAHLSGESLGGWVAARFALRYPARVARLVLNTTGGATMDPAVMQRIKTLTMAAVTEPEWNTVKARLEWLMANPATVTDDLIACRQAIYRAPGMPEAMPHILCLQEPEIRQRNNLTEAEWRAIAAPTLVLWTDKDPTAAAEVGERLAGLIPEAQFALMKGCGHWPQFEDPETFNALHLRFLKG